MFMEKMIVLSEIELSVKIEEEVKRFYYLLKKEEQEKVEQDAVLNKQQACDYLNVSLSTLNRLLKSNNIVYSKMSKNVRIKKSALDNYLNNSVFTNRIKK